MEVECSFRAIVGGSCSQLRRKDTKSSGESSRIIIPLLSCEKDISNHKSLFSFNEPVDEVDLIFSRAAIFSRPKDIKSWTVCSHHRHTLGLGWTRGANTRCRVPVELSNHGKSRSKWPKSERGIGKYHSQIILKNTGIFIPVGSGKQLFFDLVLIL